MDSSLKDEIDDGGSLLNQDKSMPFSVMEKALHLTGPGTCVAPCDSCRY